MTSPRWATDDHPQRLVIGGSGAMVRAYLTDAEGEADDTLTPTVTVTRWDGTAVLTNAAAALHAEWPGVYEAALNVAQVATLDRLTATWSDNGAVIGVTDHLVVGSRMFPLSRLRSFPGLNEDRADALELAIARDAVEHRIDHVTGVAWSPRLSVDTFDLRTDAEALFLTQPLAYSIRGVTIGGTAIDTTTLVLGTTGSSVLRRRSSWWPAGTPIVVAYEHGHGAAPLDLAEAALLAAVDKLRRDRSPNSMRARTISSDVGTTEFVIASDARPFGLPDVDAVVVARRWRQPRIGGRRR